MANAQTANGVGRNELPEPADNVARRNLRALAERKIAAKQCQRIAIRCGNERLDEQQHGQSDDAPANDWSGRAAVIRWYKRSLRPGRDTIISGWRWRPNRIDVVLTKPKSKRSWATA